MTAVSYVSIASLFVALASFIFNIRDKRKDRHRLIEADIEVAALFPQGIDLPQLTINWSGKTLDAPRLWTITFTNAGEAALKVADIEQAATMTFLDGEIIDATAGVRRSAGNERLTRCDAVEINDLEVRAPKVLLNRKNQLVVYVLTNKSEKLPEIDLGANDFEVAVTARRPATPARNQFASRLTLVCSAIGLVTGLLALLSVL